MTATMWSITVRYRPLADVLVGVVDGGRPAGTPGDVTEAPDLDTALVWSPTGADGAMQLRSFQLLHARARLDEGCPPWCPSALFAHLHSAVAVATAELDTQASLPARLAAVAVSRVDVPRAALARPGAPAVRDDAPVVRAWPASSELAPRLAHELRRVAHLVATRPTASVAPRGPMPGVPLVVDRLDELAAVLAHGAGRVAPGTAAAARHAVASSTVLSPGERVALGGVLTDVDHPERWAAAVTGLQRVATGPAPP